MEINPTAQKYIDIIAEKCQKIKPLVAIHCVTYNHEAYLRDALESFVNQKTDFPFVAIVHEDVSTDGTAAILRKYADKYPNIILPILENENQYSKMDDSLGCIMRAALRASGVKYTAFCEGDDYWTDPLKLQKQVDFLEKNPDYTMCIHPAKGHHVDNSMPDVVLGSTVNEDVPSIIEQKSNVYYAPTPSFFIRTDCFFSSYFKKLCTIKRPAFGDSQIIITAHHYGKVRNLGEAMCTYRIHSTGAVSRIHNDPSNWYRTVIELSKLSGSDYEYVYKHYRLPRHFGTILMRWDIFPNNLITAWRLFKFAPIPIIKHTSHSTLRFIKKRLKFKK